MSCEHLQKLDAYFDGELDLANSLNLENHLESCGECQARRAQLEALRASLRQPGVAWEVPEHFEGRIRDGLPRGEWNGAPRQALPGWLKWAAVAAAAALLVMTGAMMDRFWWSQGREDSIAREVAASHVRSLLGGHPIDVVSSDQHTVKPWFNGKLDFTPLVKDLAAQGFPLEGGRIDYLDDRPVAALLYKRNQHPIHVFEWPSQGSVMPESEAIRGYHLIHWSEAGMTFWAISDLNARELGEFVGDLRK